MDRRTVMSLITSTHTNGDIEVSEIVDMNATFIRIIAANCNS
jgi:hypothetical protein